MGETLDYYLRNIVLTHLRTYRATQNKTIRREIDLVFEDFIYGFVDMNEQEARKYIDMYNNMKVK